MERESKIKIIKYAPPPPELPMYGKAAPEEVSFFGRTNYVAALEEKKFIFGIKRRDRRRHMYVIGKSGTGKSKLVELLIRQDIAYGYGLCFFDPHGDIISSILDFVPEERIKDVVLIDLADTKFPVAFNLFHGVHTDIKHQFTHALLEVIKKQFGASWTPRLEHLFRFTALALFEFPHATMGGFITMFTDENYRRSVTGHIQDEVVRRFWEKEFDSWKEKFEMEAIIPFVNKLSQFLADPTLRAILDREEGRLDFDALVKSKKIILVNCARGKLGEQNASFFASLLLIKIRQVMMMRAGTLGIPHEDFYLYLDDFSIVVTETFESILAEGRKYGFCLTLAHQYLGQLSPEVQAAVLGNIGTIISFRVGGEDAFRLKPEMTPIFDVKDLINLGTQEFYIKMMIDGEAYDPFSAETLKVLPSPQVSHRDEIIAYSRSMYAR